MSVFQYSPRVTTRRISFIAGALCVLALSALAVSSTAYAQDARARFQRGVELFDEGRYDAALAEFEEAYRIAPSHAVLFNLGQVHARLGQAVEAVEAYERYLSEGDAALPADRRALVERELAIQRARIGSLSVEVGVDGAGVSVDGSFVARTPLAAPIRVAVGEHVVEVHAGGYESQQRRVTVAGGVVEIVRFELAETGSARGTIRFTTALHDVEVSVDGVVVGRTPLESSISVPPGLREVRAVRPGYRPFQRSVQVGMAAEAEVAVELESDLAATALLGQLRVSLPPGASLFVDGAPMDPSSPLTLPHGDHELRVEMPDVVASVRRVIIEAQQLVVIAPELRYTPAARAERVASASSQQTAGAALTILGGLLLAGGASVTIWNELQRGELGLDQRRALLTSCNAMLTAPANECFDPAVIPAGTEPAFYRDALDLAEARFNSDVDAVNGFTALGYGLMGLGAASLLVSVIVLLTAPSDEDTTTVRVGIGPGGAQVAGTF